MHVIVVGGGVVGIATAYGLAADGHDVELFDAHGDLAAGATSTNAGLLIPVDSVAWAGPGAPLAFLKSLFSPHAHIKLRPGAGAMMVSWMTRFLANCTAARARTNMLSTYALSTYSLRETEALVRATDIDCAFVRNGNVYLFGDEAELQSSLRERQALAAVGERIERLTPQQLVDRDQGFAGATETLHAALYAPDAATGNSQAFARRLAVLFTERGGRIRTGVAVERIVTKAGRATGVATNGEVVPADRIVVAAGARTPRIAGTAGVRASIIPIKGYSASVPILKDDAVPRIGGVDMRSHVAFSPMGPRLRLSCTAEFNGFNSDIAAKSVRGLREAGEQMFAGALDWDRAEYRTGWRPATPTSNPYLGETPVENLFLNAGHGHLGWTQACGSARIIADLIAGRTPAIDVEPYRPG